MGFDLKMVDSLSQNILDTLKRFPLATLSAFIVTIIVISIMELNHLKLPTNTYTVLVAKKIALVASLGIFLFPALELVVPKLISSLIGVAILSWYYIILPLDIDSSVIIFRHLILMVAVFLMLFWTPFITIKISNKNIWEWTQHLILSLVASIFFSTLLYIGIALALFAIEKLFNIEISPIRYAQVAVIIFGIYGVNLFLSQIPKYIILLQARRYTKAEEIFTKYILTTLTVGYFLIIFIYSLKILFSMSWPSGVVAWISIIFSIIAILTYLFWTPLFEEENIKFKVAIWGAILFQTIMLAIALYFRIKEYGFTESRYFVTLFGVWLFLMSLYFLFIKNASYKWLFVTITLLLIGSQFGKYSAINFSKLDQLQRVESMLEKKESLTPKEQQNLYSAIEYLYSRDRLKSLTKVMPDIIDKYKDLNETIRERVYFPNFAIKRLGLENINSKNRYIRFSPIRPRYVLNIKGYNWLVEFNYNKNYQEHIYTKKIKITFEKNILTIINGKKVIKVDFSKLIESLGLDRRDNFVAVPNEKLEYRTKDIKILFESINIDTKKREIIDFVAKILF